VFTLAETVTLDAQLPIPVSSDEQALLQAQADSRKMTLDDYVREVIQLGLWVIREREGGADVAAKRPDGRSAVLKATKK
jgi:hypothetical protein